MNRTLEKIKQKKLETKIYSITISPHYRFNDPTYLYNEDIRIIIRWFRKFSKHWILFTEFDEASRIHYHGTIYIHDMIKFHKTRWYLNQKLGFVKIKLLKTVIDLLRWNMYIRKEYYMMYKSYPLVYHTKGLLKKVNHTHKILNKPLHKDNIINWINGTWGD